MISNDQLRKTIKDCEQAGYNIGLRDIAYVLLCNHFEENASAYKIVFGLDRDYNKDNAIPYDNTSAIQYLRTYVDTVLISRPRGKIDDDISFEENKSEIIKLIKKTQDAVAANEIEIKDALKIEADLRVKLNDKFNVQSDTKEQLVVVRQKYDAVCSCGREVARRPMTKEEAMEMYNLIEKQ